MVSRGYVWGMGLFTFALVTLLFVTGTCVLLSVRRVSNDAYNDILALSDVTTLGVLLELHAWVSVALAVIVAIHLFLIRRANAGHLFGATAMFLVLVLAMCSFFCENPLTAATSAANRDIARTTPLLGYGQPTRSEMGMSLGNITRFVGLPLLVLATLGVYYRRFPRAVPPNQPLQQTGPA